jgi:hypothetical protein
LNLDIWLSGHLVIGIWLFDIEEFANHRRLLDGRNCNLTRAIPEKRLGLAIALREA